MMSEHPTVRGLVILDNSITIVTRFASSTEPRPKRNRARWTEDFRARRLAVDGKLGINVLHELGGTDGAVRVGGSPTVGSDPVKIKAECRLKTCYRRLL